MYVLHQTTAVSAHLTQNHQPRIRQDKGPRRVWGCYKATRQDGGTNAETEDVNDDCGRFPLPQFPVLGLAAPSVRFHRVGAVFRRVVKDSHSISRVFHLLSLLVRCAYIAFKYSCSKICPYKCAGFFITHLCRSFTRSFSTSKYFPFWNLSILLR